MATSATNAAASSSSPTPVQAAMARVKEAVLNMNLLVMAWGVEHYYETHNGG